MADSKREAISRAEACERQGADWDQIAKGREEDAERARTAYASLERSRDLYAFAQIAHAQAAHNRKMARAYRNVAAGKPPFARNRGGS